MSDVVAMMSPDTTTKTKAQEIHRPSEVTAPQQMSSPSNARNMITDPSDTYLAPQFQAKFEQVAKATMQEIHRARTEAWVESFLLSVQASHPSGKKTTNPTEPAGPVPSGAKVRSRVINIRKDLNTRLKAVFETLKEFDKLFYHKNQMILKFIGCFLFFEKRQIPKKSIFNFNQCFDVE